MSKTTLLAIAGRQRTDSVARDCMAEMVQRLRVMLAMDDIDAFPRTHRLPGGFFDEYAAALAAYDRYIAHVIAAGKLQISCRAGCSACCRHELARGVTSLEIFAIYRFVHGWSDVDAVYERAGQNAVAFQRLLRTQMQQQPGPIIADDPRVYDAHIAYNRLERPCPFLDLGAGTCRIYSVRPLVCRWFYNLSPKEWCEPSHPRYLEREAFGVDPYQEINDLMAAISGRLGVTTLNYLPGAFVHVAGDLLQGRPIG